MYFGSKIRLSKLEFLKPETLAIPWKKRQELLLYTMYYEIFRIGGRNSEDRDLVPFMAGDDPDAKDVVSKLGEIVFTPVDTGLLCEVDINSNRVHPYIIIP